MKLSVLFFAVLVASSCANKKKNPEVALTTIKTTTIEEVDKVNFENPDLEIYDYAGFEKFLKKKDGKTYVVNFWATWCGPCVKELPYFETLNSTYKSKNVEVILVSLDFPHLYEKKLKPFIKQRKLKCKVIALDDPDMNSWIPKVDKNWSGSIPATVIYNNDQRKFFEKSFTFNELEQEVKLFLK